jgi:hypothetical protein
MIFPSGSLDNIRRLIISDVQDLINPIDSLFDPANDAIEAPQNPKFQIVKRKNWFIERAGSSYFTLTRALIQNRSRLRRMLCHAILDWDSLQVEAEEVDTELRGFTGEMPMNQGGEEMWSYPLSSWVYHYKLRQMEWVHLLGFELEIYLPYEFAGMFWYIQYYVQMRLGHLQRIQEFALANGTMQMKNCSNNKSELERIENELNQNRSLLNLHLLDATALHEITGGLQHLYLALSKLGLLKKGEQSYGADQLRYELRMKPFLAIGLPEVVPFERWQELVDPPDVEVLELLGYASESVTEARKYYDRLSKLDKAMARVLLCEGDYRLVCFFFLVFLGFVLGGRGRGE